METVTGSTTLRDRGRVTIPKAVRERLGLSEGDTLLFRVTPSGNAEVVPMAQVPRDQVWFYAEEMQRRVAEAEEDIALGRTTRLTSPEAVRAHLDALKSGSR